MTDDLDREGRDGEGLDDEAPPDIPNLDEEPRSARPPMVSSPAIEVAVETDAAVAAEVVAEAKAQEERESLRPPAPDLQADAEELEASPISSRRLSPPPKPQHRRRSPRSITAPQTPASRQTPPPPASDTADELAASALRAPRTPNLDATPTNALTESEASEKPRTGSVPPRAVSTPPRPTSQAPRPLSEPPRQKSVPPRPVSEPPRPASEPPRAASNPPRATSDPPRPTSDLPPRALASEAEIASEAARVRRASHPELDAEVLKPRARQITVPDDDVPVVPEASSAKPDSIPPMRIIDIGGHDGPPPMPEAAGEVDAAEELGEDDVAPESEPKPAQQPAKPPPPPRRATPSSGRRLEEPQSKQRRPWWEEVFSEDFVRAVGKVTDGQVAREVDFIEESLGVAPGGVVLDLACGVGQHSVEMSRRGYGVVGYDLSLFQLALAAEVAQEHGQKLNLLQGDMREMAFEEMFDGVFCWNTSFGYFEEEKNHAVAERVFKALRPGGMLLLDVANRDFVAQHQPAQTWYEGDACVCMDDMSLDFITSRLRVKRSLILDDGRSRECVYSIRLYTLHELGKLLHDVGFRVTEASGDPSTPGVFFGANSPRIIILAQRP